MGERSLVLWHVETNAICIYFQLKSFSNSEIAAMIGGLALVDVSNEYEEAMNNRSLLGLIAAACWLRCHRRGERGGPLAGNVGMPQKRFRWRR